MRIFAIILFVILTAAAAGIYGCRHQEKPAGSLHFTAMPKGHIGIHFNNKITESGSVNVDENEYMYNGSGVGIGDFNNDGLADVFFAGSMVSSRLYLNKGAFVFEDITGEAGLQTAQWCTGVRRTFTVVPSALSGFVVEGDVRNLKTMTLMNREVVLVAVNNEKLKLLDLQKKNR